MADDKQVQVDETQEQSQEPTEDVGENQAVDQTEELKNQLARALADLQNYKRRSEEERGSFVKFANAELLKALIPTFDNFDRSAAHLPEDLKGNDWAKGVMIVHENLMTTLEKLGVSKIDTIGQKLDPKRHEALMAGPGEKDIITEEFEAGYSFQDETIKVAKVKVGDGSQAEAK
ncbi:MAG: nucleotide exchange factor GrpE [Candidatus Peregrinibacteria bacterium]|nr:nucleotide exchange factor GrpE [Candidatus Peregrinibacteria bacterium]